ncbi:MAG: protein kinase [Magnetococcus sp. DMHC-6]
MACPRCDKHFIIESFALGSNFHSPITPHDSTPTAGDRVPVDWTEGDLILGIYKVTGLLGVGGMGKVYKVHHLGWNMDLAVKSPKPEILTVPGAVDSFMMEAENWVNLGLHPNTCSCYYVRELGGIPRLFAEFVTGGDLDSWIKGDRKKSIAPKLYEGEEKIVLGRMLDIAVQFAWGLHFAHTQGMIHQDIKPANVMLTPEGNAKVTDFGLARMRHSEQPGTTTNELVESAGMSPRWCSPEQSQQHSLSNATDIWSWALSVLSMFVGAEGKWQKGTMAPTIMEGFRSMGLRARDTRIPPMPEKLADILTASFQIDPKARPSHLGDLADDLANLYEKILEQPFPRPVPKLGRAQAESLNNRAVSLLDLGREEEAGKLWDQALTLHPNHPDSTYNSGLNKWRQVKIPDDLPLTKNMEEVRLSQSNNWRPYYLLGLIHLERGDCWAVQEVLSKLPPAQKQQEDIRQLKAAALHYFDQSRRLLGVFSGHKGSVRSVRFTEDGRLAVSGGDDGDVRVWDLVNRRCLHVLTALKTKITAVAVNRQGSIAVCAGEDQLIRVWNIITGKMLRILQGHVKTIESLFFSHDGQHILSGGSDNLMMLWDLASGRELMTFQGVAGPINAVALNRNGQLALSGSGSSSSSDHALQLWDVTSGKCLYTIGHRTAIKAVAFNEIKEEIVSAGLNGVIRIMELSSGELLQRLTGHTAPINDIGVTANGRYLISASGAPFTDDNTLKLWELKTGRCLRTFAKPDSGPIFSVAFTPDGRFALAATGKGDVEWWLINTEKYVWQAPMVLSRVQASEVVFTALSAYEESLGKAEKVLKMGSPWEALSFVKMARSQSGFSRGEEALKLLSQLYQLLPKEKFQGGWEVNSLQLEPDGGTAPVTCVAHDNHTQHILTGNQNGILAIWDGQTETPTRSFKGHQGTVESITISGDGRSFLSGGSDSLLQLWDMKTGQLRHAFSGHTQKIRATAISWSGHLILSSGADETIRLWNPNDGSCQRIYKGHQGQVLALAMGLTQNRFLSAGEDGTIRLWYLNSPKSKQLFTNHKGQVFSLDISLDGRFFLSGSSDRTVILWELKSGKPLKVMEGHTDFVRSVRFCTNGWFAASGSNDQTIKLWDLSSGKCLRTFTGHRGNVNAVTFSPDGSRIFSAGSDQLTKIWFLDWELGRQPLTEWNPEANHLLKAFSVCQEWENRPNGYSMMDLFNTLFPFGKKNSQSSENLNTMMFILRLSGFGYLKPEKVGHQMKNKEKWL